MTDPAIEKLDLELPKFDPYHPKAWLLRVENIFDQNRIDKFQRKSVLINFLSVPMLEILLERFDMTNGSNYEYENLRVDINNFSNLLAYDEKRDTPSGFYYRLQCLLSENNDNVTLDCVYDPKILSEFLSRLPENIRESYDHSVITMKFYLDNSSFHGKNSALNIHLSSADRAAEKLKEQR